MQRKVLSIFIGLILLVILLEISIRMSAFVFSQNQQARNQKFENISNKKTISIVTIGESTTAVAANELKTQLIQETAYPFYLEKYLNEKDSPYHFEVTNKGIMAGDTEKIILELKKYLKDHRPNIIVAMMGMKDVRNFNYFKKNPEREWNSWINQTLQTSSVYNFVRLLYDQMFLNSLNIKDDKIVEKYEDLPKEFIKGYFLKMVYESINKQLASDNPSDEQLKTIIKALSLGQYFFFTGQYKKSEQILTKSIKQNGFGYFLLANLYSMNNEHQKAESTLLSYREKYPANPYIYKDLAFYYLNNKKLEEAKSILEIAKAKRLGEELPVLIASSQVEKEAGQFKTAILSLVPKCGNNNSSNFAELKEIMDANANSLGITNQATIKLFMQKDNYEECVYFLSELYYLSKNYELAEKKLLHLNQINPYLHFGSVLLRKVYEDQGKIEKSMEFMKTLSDHNNRLGEYYALVNLYKQSNRSNEILDIYKTTKKDFAQTSDQFKELYQLAKASGAKLILMQYPTFSLDFLKNFTSDLKDVYYVSNETIFDNSPKTDYFFEPRFPYSFNHYTNLGSQTLARNLAREIHVALKEGKL